MLQIQNKINKNVPHIYIAMYQYGKKGSALLKQSDSKEALAWCVILTENKRFMICKVFRLLQQMLCEFQKIEKRERLDAIFRERETRRKETQQR